MGCSSKKTNPLVRFGLHHERIYGFLVFHVFKELITMNPMWLILVGEWILRLGDDEAGNLS